MRSLQPPDILWIHWRVYNFIANTSKRVLFLAPSDAYVRSFLYLLYTLIKLYYTKALSNEASSLAPDWILLLQRPRILASFHSATTFQLASSFHSLSLLLKLIPSTRWVRSLSVNLVPASPLFSHSKSVLCRFQLLLAFLILLGCLCF